METGHKVAQVRLHCCRERVQPLLADLCAGCGEGDLPAALSGLLADGAHVRGAALAVLPAVPVLAGGTCPPDPAVSTMLWMAKFDASPGAPHPPRLPGRASSVATFSLMFEKFFHFQA